MRIRVTQEHIDRGFRGDCDSCPITLAILERFPGWYVQTTPVDVGSADTVNLFFD
jgi:hypothetical protein